MADRDIGQKERYWVKIVIFARIICVYHFFFVSLHAILEGRYTKRYG